MWFLQKKNGECWQITRERVKPYVGKLVRLENSNGGYHYYKITEQDEIFSSTWEKVLYEYYKNNQNTQYGWLSPRGEFFGCEYYDHAQCIHIVSGMYEKDAELAGWIKIYYEPARSENPNGCSYWLPDSWRMTKAQRDELLMRGFNV